MHDTWAGVVLLADWRITVCLAAVHRRCAVCLVADLRWLLAPAIPAEKCRAHSLHSASWHYGLQQTNHPGTKTATAEQVHGAIDMAWHRVDMHQPEVVFSISANNNAETIVPH